jgi:Rieske Fe-S protein
MADQPLSEERRGFFRLIINGVSGLIGASLAVVLGGAALSPAFRRRDEHWIPAGRKLGDLETGQPTPVILRVVRQDGYYEAVDHQVVFLIKQESGQVTAVSSTCTHLGCRVSWDAASKTIRCPCHGGVFNAKGEVIGGPPPKPLATLATRIDNNTVLVQV